MHLCVLGTESNTAQLHALASLVGRVVGDNSDLRTQEPHDVNAEHRGVNGKRVETSACNELLIDLSMGGRILEDTLLAPQVLAVVHKDVVKLGEGQDGENERSDQERKIQQTNPVIAAFLVLGGAERVRKKGNVVDDARSKGQKAEHVSENSEGTGALNLRLV